MGKVSDLTPRKKAKIEVYLSDTSYSQAQIATKLGVSQKSVSRIKRKLSFGLGLEANRSGKCGRKRLSGVRDDRVLIRKCLQNRKATSMMLNLEWYQTGVHVSSRTVRRRLVDNGLRARKPLKKPKLTPTMTRKRLEWAKIHRLWTPEDWSRVCFSDESTFEIMVDKARFVRRRTGEAFNRDCIVERVKHPTSVMVWSVISVHGPGRLYIVEGMMNQVQYKKVLETRLLPQLREWFPDGHCIFMQDGAPCHTAKSVKQFLQVNNVPLLPWPGNSPDCNPIENMWEIVKRRIATLKPTTKTSLIEGLIEVWCHDPDINRMCSSIIHGMPRRVAEVIKFKGGTTKY